MRIEIIRPHKDLLLARWHSERAHPRHDIAHHFAWMELLNQPTVLGLQPAVPIDAGVVKAELAVLLVHGDIGVIVAGKQLEGESAEFRMRPYVFNFVDYRADRLVFVLEDFGDEVFVWEVLFPEVQMHCIHLVLESRKDD